MTIQVGDRLPDATFKVMTPDGPANRTTAEAFGGRKVVLFAVPGAFTPSCHKNHMPGYVQNFDAFKAKGIDAVVCTSVNDVFVQTAWAKESGADGRIEFLADGSAAFASALGLTFDGSAGGLGTRSKRYSMLVEDGVVKSVNVEEAAGKVESSSADALLKTL